VLDELKVDTLVLTGCLTEIGMLATATHALEMGFAVEVPPDSQAGASAEAEQMAMGLLTLMPPYGAARKARLERIEAR
jgi:nicotinamidase-related amidase